MLKKIWSFVTSPFEALKKKALKGLIPSIFQTLQGYVTKYVNYAPLEIYVQLKLNRINEIAKLLLDDPEDSKGVLRRYLKEHKIDLIREQVDLINSIKAEHIRDPELTEIFTDFTNRLSGYLIEKKIKE